MAKQPTREQLAAALIELFDDMQQIKYGLAHLALPLIDKHNERAFKEMKKQLKKS